MLAYIDEILDPATAQEMRQRIEASDRAEELMNRIRECREPRSRPDAPAIDAQGIATDANSIAEYLDNTLPAEQVPDFERVCLDSDGHLAEVAACHQLLAQALDKKTHIPASLRTRLHQMVPADRSARPEPQAPPMSAPSKPHLPLETARTSDVPNNHKQSMPVRPARSDRAWRTDSGPVGAPAVAPKQKRSPLRTFAIAAMVTLLLSAAGIIAMSDRLSWLSELAMGPATSSQDEQVSPEDSEQLTPSIVDTGQNAESPVAPEPPLIATTPPAESADSQEPAAEPAPPSPSSVADASAAGPTPAGTTPAGTEPAGAETAATTTPSTSSAATSEPDAPHINPFVKALNGLESPSAPSADAPSTDASPAATATAGAATPAAPAPAEPAPAEPTTAPGAGAEPVPPPSPAAVDIAGETASPAEPAADASASSGTTEPGPSLAASDRGAAIGKVEFDPSSVSEPEPTAPLEAPVPWTIAQFDNNDPLTRLVLIQSMGGVWTRLAPAAQGTDAVELLSLPAFRPRVQVDKFQIQLIGATRATLQRSNKERLTGLNLAYGRAIVSNSSDANQQLELGWAGRKGTLTLGPVGSRVAVEVTPLRVPGTDPMTVAPNFVLEMTMLDGTAEWTDAEHNDAMPLDPKVGLRTIDNYPLRTWETTAAPAWTDPKQTAPAHRLPIADIQQLGVPRQIDLDGAKELERMLSIDGDPQVLLTQTNERRQVEVRSLAVRSLVHLGSADPLVTALGDVNHKASWPLFMAELSAAIARGPEPATTVKQSLERKYPDQASDLFRTLIGYNPDQLREGGAQILVDQLESEDLIRRIFAFESLKEITGGKTFNYQPDDRTTRPDRTPRRARTAMTRWREQLDDGAITYAALPRVIELLQKAEAAGATSSANGG